MGRREGEREGEKMESYGSGSQKERQWLVGDLWEVRALILPSLSGNSSY